MTLDAADAQGDVSGAAPPGRRAIVNRSGQLADARWPIGIVAVPVAAAIVLAAHRWIPNRQLTPDTHYYPILLWTALALALAIAGLSALLPALRRWVGPKAPLFAAALLVLCAWELITLKFDWLPLPYFPGPEPVLGSLISDRAMLFSATWQSLARLLGGYTMGMIAGLISGVMIGWWGSARYWGMPLLKIVGPIPATAWIPLSMIVFPSPAMSVMSLIALAVWFPVTMLTASGVSNTRASYLDVARTLGAGRLYLIFRVAIPAAMPNIFIGAFMGLGASFLTLLAAETVGVNSGLGWYITWGQASAEYDQIFAALVIMAVVFSAIMTLLFKLRDHVLVWQKGVIKW